MDDTTPNWDAEFESEDGSVVTRRSIGLMVRHEGVDVERVEGGFIVDGSLYRRINNGTST